LSARSDCGEGGFGAASDAVSIAAAGTRRAAVPLVAAPHPGQNLNPGDNSAPHCEQYPGPVILRRPLSWLRLDYTAGERECKTGRLKQLKMKELGRSFFAFGDWGKTL